MSLNLLDGAIADIMVALEEKDMKKETIVIFSSGEHFHGMMCHRATASC
jgi:hypothetical protein